MTRTAIEYTYRGAGGRSSLFDQGPFYFADDGRDPMVQAQERCDRYGDKAVRAERIDVSSWKSLDLISM